MPVIMSPARHNQPVSGGSPAREPGRVPEASAAAALGQRGADGTGREAVAQRRRSRGIPAIGRSKSARGTPVAAGPPTSSHHSRAASAGTGFESPPKASPPGTRVARSLVHHAVSGHTSAACVYACGLARLWPQVAAGRIRRGPWASTTRVYRRRRRRPPTACSGLAWAYQAVGSSWCDTRYRCGSVRPILLPLTCLACVVVACLRVDAAVCVCVPPAGRRQAVFITVQPGAEVWLGLPTPRV